MLTAPWKASGFAGPPPTSSSWLIEGSFVASRTLRCYNMSELLGCLLEIHGVVRYYFSWRTVCHA